MKTIEQLAAEIAEYANGCCHRSDGYENDVFKFAHTLIGEYASQDSAKLLCAKSAIKLLQENTALIEHADELQMTLTVPIKRSGAKAKVAMVVKIVEA